MQLILAPKKVTPPYSILPYWVTVWAWMKSTRPPRVASASIASGTEEATDEPCPTPR